MQKPFTFVLPLLVMGMLLGSNSYAQQSSAAQAAPAQTAPAKTQATKPKTSTAATGTKAKTGTTTKSAGATTLTTPKDKFSYALGMNIGSNLGASLKKQSVEFDPNILAKGLRDALSGNKLLLSEDEMRTILMNMQKQVQQAQEQKMQIQGAANKKEGDEFLAANKGKEGVVTLPSGLEYKIEKQGTGPKPTTSDTVVCNYRGTLINGTEFDSSYKRGQPATFPVSGVIKGWTEALQLMPVGSKWQLFVPANLAYGERSPDPSIGPNSTLIFEVELLSIQDKNQNANQEKKP